MLWCRAGAGMLSPAQMGELYRLVWSMLAGYHPPELQGLRDDREELIAQFLFRRVLRLADRRRAGPLAAGGDADRAGQAERAAAPPPIPTRGSAPTGRAAVRAYFRRFLIDCQRSADQRLMVPLLPAADDLSEPASLLSAAVDATSVDDPGAEAAGVGPLTPDQVRRAARRFVAALPPVRRDALARALAVDDRHPGRRRAARALGIVEGRGPGAACFAGSPLGRWIEIDLGLRIEPANRDSIGRVLEILATEPLLAARDDDGAQSPPAGARPSTG